MKKPSKAFLRNFRNKSLAFLAQVALGLIVSAAVMASMAIIVAGIYTAVTIGAIYLPIAFIGIAGIGLMSGLLFGALVHLRSKKTTSISTNANKLENKADDSQTLANSLPEPDDQAPLPPLETEAEIPPASQRENDTSPKQRQGLNNDSQTLANSLPEPDDQAPLPPTEGKAQIPSAPPRNNDTSSKQRQGLNNERPQTENKPTSDREAHLKAIQRGVKLKSVSQNPHAHFNQNKTALDPESQKQENEAQKRIAGRRARSTAGVSLRNQPTPPLKKDETLAPS